MGSNSKFAGERGVVHFVLIFIIIFFVGALMLADSLWPAGKAAPAASGDPSSLRIRVAQLEAQSARLQVDAAKYRITAAVGQPYSTARLLEQAKTLSPAEKDRARERIGKIVGISDVDSLEELLPEAERVLLDAEKEKEKEKERDPAPKRIAGSANPVSLSTIRKALTGE